MKYFFSNLYLYLYLKSRPLIVIVSLYLVSRLTNLTLLPIFMDEANYLDWGWREVFLGVPFHSLYDAKQPLLMWAFGLAQSLPVDPLFAARSVSVLTGLVTLLGLYYLGIKLYNQKVSISISLLYLVAPIFLFFDRQALMESSLSAISVWSFYFLHNFLKKPQLKTILILGFILGIGFLIKSTALVYVFTVSLIIAINFVQKRQISQGIYYLLFFFLTISISISILLLQPMFWQTLSFASRYTLTLPELLQFPLSLWLSNLEAVLEISFVFLTPPVFIFALLKIKSLPKSLILYIVIPLILLIFSSRSLNFRYVVNFLPLLLLPASQVISHLRYYWYPVSLSISITISILVLFTPPLYFRTLSRFTRFSYQEGYINGDSTGYQVMNTISYLKDQSKDKKILVGVGLNVGNPEAAIFTYLRKNPHVSVAYLDSRILPDLSSYSCLSSSLPLYFVAREQQQAGLNKFFAPVTTITNSYNTDYHTIYTLKPDCVGSTLPINITPTQN